MNDENIFGDQFKAKSWDAWKTFLRALFGLPISIAEMNLYKQCTARSDLPRSQPGEVYLVIGRRGGKSIICALIATYLATCRNYEKYRARGETLVVMLLAANRAQAKILFDHIRANFELPILSSMVANRKAESIELTNHVSIEIHTSDYRSLRGRTVIACCGDELAFWGTSSDGTPNDKEILDAVRPSMATIPDILLICLSSPYSKRGELWRNHQEYYGRAGAPVLIWQAASRVMNPSLPRITVAAAHLRDAVAARSEWEAEFRSDLSSFLSLELVEAAMQSYVVLPPLPDLYYYAFVDAAGGGGSDSYSCAIGHYDAARERVIVDCLKEITPPFSPEAATAEICALLREYGISEISGDKYAGLWVAEQFQKRGIRYVAAELNRSEIYLEAGPAFTAGRVDLPRNGKLKNQFIMLERKTVRTIGRDSVDHPAGCHDDCSNAVAGVIVEVLRENGIGGCFGLAEWEAQGGSTQVLDPVPGPKAITTVFKPDDPFSGSSKYPPAIPPKAPALDLVPCFKCGGELEVVDQATRTARCTRCGNYPIQLQFASRFAPTPYSQTRGEWLEQGAQPMRFGRPTSRFAWKKSGRR
jgi:hypothetical protein